MAYQSLYRRYRPQKFSEIRGQPHIVAALQNAVARNEVGHAYLFHGPRGTGKTTSARILAKALNCEDLGDDAEPCGSCESCVAIEEGRSFDLHELDAASNNRVDDMRDLLAKVNLGTPGRAKVYILDEVHMLTPGAENALLKTLEEPPEHVVWVLATTEPHKVVQTIRSRCQVFELNLLGADEMSDHVRWVIADAGLDVDEAGIDHVVSVGGGSVRDTLSALDRVVAAGGVVATDESTDRLLGALADRDTTAALTAVGEAMGRGRDPRTIGESVLAGLRQGFLTAMGSPLPRATASEQARADDLATRMSPARFTRALETLGTALVEMRQAPDPRVDLEVALVRLCRADADGSVDALVERIDALEARLAGSAPVPAPQPPVPEPPPPTPEPPAPPPEPVAPEAEPVAPEAEPVAAEAEPVAAEAEPVAAEAEPVAPETDMEEAVDRDVAGAGSIPPPPVPAAVAASEEAVPRSGGPAAAARRALADAGGRSPEPEPAGPAGETDAVPVPVAPAAPAPDPDLRSLRPTSPREVVELAARHLGIGRDAVVERANTLLGPSDAPRSVGDLTRLWVTLVDDPVAGARGDDIDDPGPGPGGDDIDLTDLVDAPARADEVVELLSEAFPGAELTDPQEPDA